MMGFAFPTGPPPPPGASQRSRRVSGRRSRKNSIDNASQASQPPHYAQPSDPLFKAGASARLKDNFLHSPAPDTASASKAPTAFSAGLTFPSIDAGRGLSSSGSSHDGGVFLEDAGRGVEEAGYGGYGGRAQSDISS